VFIGNASAAASRTGAPVTFSSSLGSAPQADFGTVRSDVSYVTVTYGNGQVLTLRPVDVLGPKYAPFVAVIAPYPGAVVRVTAYSGTGELGYAVPLAYGGSFGVERWLDPGQPALPRPVTRLIGAGTTDGKRWYAKVAIGPWGTCIYGSGPGSDCWAQPYQPLARDTVVSPVGGISVQGTVDICPGQASAAVAYLEVTTKDGTTARVPVVTVGPVRFYAYADGPGNRVVRWAAYGASGQKLASGRGELT
jgi:hypothetical protein